MALDNHDLMTIFKTEFSQSTGGNDSLKAERKRAFDRYLNEPTGNEVEGQSDVQTSDVADVVDGMMPSLLRIFTTADNLVSFDPTSTEDIPKADQETDYVSHVFFKKNQAFLILYYWFFDALLQKNGYCVAWWDESEKITEESYDNLTLEAAAVLLKDKELEGVEREENEDGTHNIRFRRVTARPGKVSVAPVPPDEMRISNDANSLDPGSGRMVGREREISRTDLIDMGFDPKQVNELGSISPTSKTKTSGGKGTRAKSAPVDKSQELINVREGYLKVDWDEDGRAELRQIFTGDDKLLRWKDGTDANVVVDRQPYHTLSPSPLPHQHIGRSSAEKVLDNQDTTTALLRGSIDNLYRVNMPGHAVWEQGMSENTLDDLLTTRIGAVRRFSRPPDQAYREMTTPFTGAATFPVLDYFDKVKRERSGIGPGGEGLAPDQLKNIQTTVVDKQVEQSKEKIEIVARIFAETGLTSLFLHIHELTLKHQDKPAVARLRNEFVEINPKEWRTREDMTVNIGLGIGTREQNRASLDAISAKQAEQVAGGGLNLTVTPKNIYNTSAEYVKNANLKDPSMFFTDPGDKPAPVPPDEATKLAAKEAELEERRQKLDDERNQINIAKVELKREEQGLKHQRDMIALQEKHEERLDKYELANEKLHNELMELQAAQQLVPLEAAGKIAEIKNKEADTVVKRATAARIVEEAKGLDLENDAAETGLLELVEATNGEDIEAE